MRLIWMLLPILLIQCSAQAHGKILPVLIEDAIAWSDLIVEGIPLSTSKTQSFAYIKFKVTRCLKGNLDSKIITVRGQLSHPKLFEIGQRSNSQILLLNEERRGNGLPSSHKLSICGLYELRVRHGQRLFFSFLKASSSTKTLPANHKGIPSLRCVPYGELLKCIVRTNASDYDSALIHRVKSALAATSGDEFLEAQQRTLCLAVHLANVKRILIAEKLYRIVLSSIKPSGEEQLALKLMCYHELTTHFIAKNDLRHSSVWLHRLNLAARQFLQKYGKPKLEIYSGLHMLTSIKFSYVEDLSNCFHQVARLHNRSGNQRKALRYIDRALQVAKTTDSKVFHFEIVKMYSDKMDILESRGEIRAACSTFIELTETTDPVMLELATETNFRLLLKHYVRLVRLGEIERANSIKTRGLALLTAHLRYNSLATHERLSATQTSPQEDRKAIFQLLHDLGQDTTVTMSVTLLDWGYEFLSKKHGRYNLQLAHYIDDYIAYIKKNAPRRRKPSWMKDVVELPKQVEHLKGVSNLIRSRHRRD